MSLWYDSRRHEYAMDGKNGWFIKYCDKLAADFGKLCEEHFKGIANRHKADDVDYDDEMTVKEKLDKETADRKAVDENIMTGLEFERSAREGADTALGNRIDAEAEARQSADTTLDDKIDKETERSKAVEKNIMEAFNIEQSARESGDTALGERIDAEAEARQSADTTLDDKIDKETERSKAVEKNIMEAFDIEQAARVTGDTALGKRIDDEIAQRQAADQFLEDKLNNQTNVLNGKAAKGNTSEEEVDTLFAPGIYTVSPSWVIYVGEDAEPHNDAEPTVLIVAKSPGDNVTYQIAFCLGPQSSDGTMDNNEGDYDCILWRYYGSDKQWHNWRQFTSGGSGQDDGGNPFVMYGKYDLTQHPYGIVCTGDPTNDNRAWGLDWVIPPISISNSIFGTIQLKEQDEVYELTENSKGKTFHVFAEYKQDSGYARTKIILDENPICKKDYAILKSSEELDFIRLYLGNFTVNDILISPPGPDGGNYEASADISYNYPENNNPEIYILNYVYLTDARGSFKNGAEGFNAGDQSDASDGGGAIGRLAKTTSGGAVGSEAESKNGFAGGYNVKVTGMGAAIGANAHAYHGGAVGSGAQSGSGFAGGMNAKCGKAPNGADIDCIQLGTGTNGSEKTLKVYDYQLLDKDGYIPSERMAKGSLQNPITVTEEELNKTWKPGWYMCDFNSKIVYTDKNITHGQKLVQVINETTINNNGITEYWIYQYVYEYSGITKMRSVYADEEDVNSFAEILGYTIFDDWDQVDWMRCMGELVNLKTTNKHTLVEAINEVNDGILTKSQISIYPNMGGGLYVPKPIQTGGQVDSDGNGGYVWNVSLYNDIFNYPITVSDPIFGKFDIGIPPKNGEVGYGSEGFKWEGTLSQLQPDTDVRLYLKCNVQHDTKTNTITPISWENVTIHSGSNINFIEMKNGNTINAIYVYCGRLVFDYDITFPGGLSQPSAPVLPGNTKVVDCDAQLYGNRVDMTSTAGDAAIKTLQDEVESLKAEIQELKQSFAASINSIGDGLKITGGELSIDCASVSDTENAVNEIIK